MHKRLFAALLLLALPATAAAHGIGGSAADKSVIEFVPLGIEHMALGYDHLLFILGVVLLAGELGRAAKLISLFVAGHSLTLLIATLAGWKLNATFVDVVIAFSVVFVGVTGLRAVVHRERARERRAARAERGLAPETTVEARRYAEDWSARERIVFGFGLIHGLGLSTRLQDLGLPEDGLLARVIAFNIGVEIGQLISITLIVGAGLLLLRRVPELRGFRSAAFGAITASGLIVAAIVSVPGGDSSGDTTKAEATGAPPKTVKSSCAVKEERQPISSEGGHPPKLFYAPAESAPEVDLRHVIGDGYLIVRYRPDLAPASLARLTNWQKERTKVVVAARPGQTEAVTGTTAFRTLTCRRFEFASLQRFGDTWFEQLDRGDFS